MVTLMMGETAGGAFGRSLAAIGTASSAEASATVSALKEVRSDLDMADAEVEVAEDKVEAAEEKLDDKEVIAASDGDKSAEQQEVNDQEVGEATEGLKDAQRELKTKKEEKAEAKVKSEAKIEELIAAGSISSKPTTGTAHVLQKMQENFLREDFADEMVAACIIELGLAPSELTNSSVKAQLSIANALVGIQSNLAENALKNDDPEKIEASLDAIKSINNLDRTSRLADYCMTHLPQFVTTAREQDVELEKLRIDTLSMEAARHRALAQSTALAAFEKSMVVCNKLPNDATKAACAAAASRITDYASGIIEVGQTQQVSIIPNETLPLIAFQLAMNERKLFKQATANLLTNKVPAVAKEELKKEKEKLDEERSTLDEVVQTLSTALDKYLDVIGTTTKLEVVRNFQNARTQLVTNLALSPNSQPLLRKQAELALQKHDNDAQQKKEQFELLDQRMKKASKSIKGHIQKVVALKKKESVT